MFDSDQIILLLSRIWEHTLITIIKSNYHFTKCTPTPQIPKDCPTLTTPDTPSTNWGPKGLLWKLSKNLLASISSEKPLYGFSPRKDPATKIAYSRLSTDSHPSSRAWASTARPPLRPSSFSRTHRSHLRTTTCPLRCRLYLSTTLFRWGRRPINWFFRDPSPLWAVDLSPSRDKTQSNIWPKQALKTQSESKIQLTWLSCQEPCSFWIDSRLWRAPWFLIWKLVRNHQ